VASALDANDHLLYNTSTGALYYDADGTGASNPIQFAALPDHPAITASDVLVS
jgi:Ca2+-binding RTX toxin-like protein